MKYPHLQSLPGLVRIHEDIDALIDRLCLDLMLLAMGRVEEAGIFHLALSGGSTPRRLFHRLVIDPRFRKLPWLQTHIWQVDERCVDHENEQSNWRMISDELLINLPTPPEQCHAMPVLETDGDWQYEKQLRNTLASNAIDCVLLGMGDDGHTASLFPRTPALTERERWIVFNDGDTIAEPRPRMTMTYPLLNAARWSAVLLTGSAKAPALQRIAQTFVDHPSDQPLTQDAIAELPVTGLTNPHLHWYLDAEAAGNV